MKIVLGLKVNFSFSIQYGLILLADPSCVPVMGSPWSSGATGSLSFSGGKSDLCL